MDKQKIIKAIEDLLDALGEDRTRVGLQETSNVLLSAISAVLSSPESSSAYASATRRDVS